MPCSGWFWGMNGFNGCGAIKSKWGIGHGICGGIRVPFIFIHRRRCHRCVPWGLWYGSALLAFDLLHLRQLQLFLWSDPSGPGVLEWIFYFLRGNNFLVCLKKNTRLMICGQRWIVFQKRMDATVLAWMAPIRSLVLGRSSLSVWAENSLFP